MSKRKCVKVEHEIKPKCQTYIESQLLELNYDHDEDHTEINEVTAMLRRQLDIDQDFFKNQTNECVYRNTDEEVYEYVGLVIHTDVAGSKNVREGVLILGVRDVQSIGVELKQAHYIPMRDIDTKISQMSELAWLREIKLKMRGGMI